MKSTDLRAVTHCSLINSAILYTVKLQKELPIIIISLQLLPYSQFPVDAIFLFGNLSRKITSCNDLRNLICTYFVFFPHSPSFASQT
jgi:hypothetical protein